MKLHFYMLFYLFVAWQSCMSADTVDLADLDTDQTGNKAVHPFPTTPNPVGAVDSPGLTMKFLDAKGKEMSAPIRSGTLPTTSSHHTYKFGMLFDLRVSYLDDEAQAIADELVSLRVSDATLRKWGDTSAALTAKTNADGIAEFKQLYLVDAQSKVTITAEANGKSVAMEVSVSSSTPDCYATLDRGLHHNGIAPTNRPKQQFQPCPSTQPDMQYDSSLSNKHVDVPQSCVKKISNMDMTLDLNLYHKGDVVTKEHYSGSYNGTHSCASAVPLSSPSNKETTIDLYSNGCVFSEINANFPLLPLVIYDSQAGNGSCN